MRQIHELKSTQESPFPSEQVIRGMEYVTMESAIAAMRQIRDLDPNLTEKNRVKLIDDVAALSMTQALRRLSFPVLSVGSEGEKEFTKFGLEVGTVLGEFGKQNGHSIWIVNDPVEGTTAAANNRPGAVSILAASEQAGLLQTPQGIHYMDKLIVPSGLQGKVFLDAPAKDNLEAVGKHFGVSKSRIKPVILDRSRNARLIEEVRDYGVNPHLIKAGDLMPALFSLVRPQAPDWDPARDNITLVMGIGGFEEGVISAAAARALGGVAQGRVWHENPEIQKQHPDLLDTDDLAPGDPKSTFVTFTPITHEEWLDIPGITTAAGIHRAMPTTIASGIGMRITSRFENDLI